MSERTVRECNYGEGRGWGEWHQLGTTDEEWRRLLAGYPDLYRERVVTVGVMFCSQGCCPGCQHCFGMGIGCHQDPCRCEFPCTCRYADEERDPKWREGCVRHDESLDTRGDWPDPEPGLDEIRDAEPCPECGAPGACGFDDEGRPMIHTIGAES